MPPRSSASGNYVSLTRRGAAVRLLRPFRYVADLLRASRLDQVLEVYTDEQAAVEPFEAGGRGAAAKGLRKNNLFIEIHPLPQKV
ncbi:MAG: hypothetical protein HYS04_05840 [Acidobacteria bacterium]|nr:hypothetical protein [Acidobacteriota bacterium]